MNASGIYTIERVSTGQLYVGSAANLRQRWNRHRFDLRRGQHRGSKLQRAWDKDGEGGFRFNVLFVCERTDLLMFEQRALDALLTVDGFNTLRIARSSLGFKHTEASLVKMADAARRRPPRAGKPCSPETRAKIGAANAGRSPSPETRAKLSAALKGKQTFLGKKHSPEARARMSAARKGKPARPEVYAALRLWHAKRRAETAPQEGTNANV
jgi:group I intron endonuclease